MLANMVASLFRERFQSDLVHPAASQTMYVHWPPRRTRRMHFNDQFYLLHHQCHPPTPFCRPVILAKAIQNVLAHNKECLQLSVGRGTLISPPIYSILIPLSLQTPLSPTAGPRLTLPMPPFTIKRCQSSAVFKTPPLF